MKAQIGSSPIMTPAELREMQDFAIDRAAAERDERIKAHLLALALEWQALALIADYQEAARMLLEQRERELGPPDLKSLN